MNCMNGPAGDAGGDGGGDRASELREAVEELVHHNDERPPAQKEQYMLMAGFVARLCVAGGGAGGKGTGNEAALSWPSARGRGFPGLVDATYAVLGKLSCNVSSVWFLPPPSLPPSVSPSLYLSTLSPQAFRGKHGSNAPCAGNAGLRPGVSWSR